MIWADKLTIFLAGCLVLVMIFANEGDPSLVINMSSVELLHVLWFLGLVWAFLRGVDWLLGGPRLRRPIERVEVIPPSRRHV